MGDGRTQDSGVGGGGVASAGGCGGRMSFTGSLPIVRGGGILEYEGTMGMRDCWSGAP